MHDYLGLKGILEFIKCHPWAKSSVLVRVPAVAAPCEKPAKGEVLMLGTKSFPWLACERRQAKDMRTGQELFYSIYF